MKLSMREVEGLTIVTLEENRLDSSSSDDLAIEIRSLVAQGATRLILDLGSVDFMDSSGIGALVAGHGSLSSSGVMIVCGLGDAVRELLETAGVDRIVQVMPNVEASILAMPE